MSRSLVIVAFFVAVIFSILAIDSLLPTAEFDTNVQSLNQSHNTIAYFIPGTAGGFGECSINSGDFSALKPHDEIVVQKSFLLDNCVSVRPIRCTEGICLPDSATKIDAKDLIQKALHIAYKDSYKNVAELIADYPGYSPEIRRWPEYREAMSAERYSVRLPEELIIFDKNANYITSRICGSHEGYCQKIKIVEQDHESTLK